MESSSQSSSLEGNYSDNNNTNIYPSWLPVIAGYRAFSDIANVLGNVIIVILVYKDCKMKTTISKLFANQALADGLTGLVFVTGTQIVRLLKRRGRIDESGTVLTLMKICLGVLYSESLQTLGATAFSLYMAICHPVKFRIYNNTITVAAFIAATWTINIFVACLFFAADDTFTNGDLMLFSFYRHDPEDIWYEVLKLVVMFLGPLLGVVCFVKVMIYKRGITQDGVQSQSNTNQLVRQSLGVMFMTTVYVMAFVVQITGENQMPINEDSHNLRILRVIVYQYLVFKLPLFLLFFKPFRKLARRMGCPCLLRNQVSPQKTGPTSSQQISRSTTTKITTISSTEKSLLHPKWSAASTSTSIPSPTPTPTPQDHKQSGISLAEENLADCKKIHILHGQSDTATELPDVD